MKSASLPLRGDIAAKPMTRPQAALTGAGILLLAMLSAIPMWNALQLLQDENFMFWNGLLLPSLLLASCVGIIACYAGVMYAFFSRAVTEGQYHREVMSIAHVFLGLLGLVLLGLSFPLSSQASAVFLDLTEHCPGSQRSQVLFSYSQVLHNIRALPECSNKTSVEYCRGYANAAPYTQFLKDMEESYACSGFCTDPPEERTVAATPTLFSLKNYKVPCAGILARDMMSFAGDVSKQLFYQGAFLLGMCVTIGLTQLVGQGIKGREKS